MEKPVKEKTSLPTDTDVVPDRAAWGSPVEFILSCLNYAVGIGNVWRFPYLVYRNGGGAFLIPFFIMLFTMGVPVFFLELIVGQYSGLGPNTAFKRMAPIFHGLGYCALFLVTIFTIYYQVIVAWTLFYTYASFDSELAWGSCNHDYNTPLCYSQSQSDICQQGNKPNDTSSYQTFFNKECHFMTEVCGNFSLGVLDERACVNETGGVYPLMKLLKRVLASEEYYNDYAMGIRGATWEHWGELRWEMVTCLFLAWLITYLCVIRGVASMGKVVYFTAVFPYLVLTALLIRGATLPGAYEGIMFYITPQWEYLKKPSVWGDAASQTFYALGIGCGSLVTLASYNKFDNNCHRDALFVSVVNTMTSVYAGFAVFSILGFMAHQLGVDVADVVQSGPGLAFIAYPEAVLQMPLPQLWAVLFFVMLVILGIGSQFAGVEAITTAILDHWPWMRKYNYLVTAGACFSCFILALPMCFQGGVFLFSVMDWNTAAWSVVIIGLLEIVLAAWLYGADRLLGNLAEMGIHLPKLGVWYWKIMLAVISPVFITAVLAFSFNDYTPAYYGTYIFPEWVDALGWMIAASSLIPFPLFALYEVYKNRARKQADWRDLFRPNVTWGPVHRPQSHLDSDFRTFDNAAFELEGETTKKIPLGGGPRISQLSTNDSRALNTISPYEQMHYP